ncbi:hypothetical protein NDU88_002872 [Pleurodeles waltl]|uniref:Uncharacterized protein n=1 Tax=Pleurodeles waltl TaxID=8319 RepID=A0AAV7LDN9_PLEWA|nr:hypothetical protein NDU88_002872 [Pleurodeles waltl]
MVKGPLPLFQARGAVRCTHPARGYQIQASAAAPSQTALPPAFPVCPGACFRTPWAPVHVADTNLPVVQGPLAPRAASAVGILPVESELGSAAPGSACHQLTSGQVSSALRRGVTSPAACRRSRQASTASGISGAPSNAGPLLAGRASAL